MIPRRLRAFGATLVLTALLAACSGDNERERAETGGKPASTTLRPGVDAGAQPLEVDEPLNIDRTDPEAVAAAWGCAYWVHPYGETAGELADRLSPLSTTAVTQALAALRLSGMEEMTVQSAPGAVVPSGPANTWTVNCTITTSVDGTMTPSAAALEVRVAAQPDGEWLVDAARHPGSGVTIP